MINAEFYLKETEDSFQDLIIGVCVKGHAGFAEFGLDIVCASVTSAVELTANAITEILKVPATVGVFENEVRLFLPECFNESEMSEEIKQSVNFLKALRLHLELLSQDYKANIEVSEVIT